MIKNASKVRIINNFILINSVYVDFENNNSNINSNIITATQSRKCKEKESNLANENSYLFKLLKKMKLSSQHINSYMKKLCSSIARDKYVKDRVPVPVKNCSQDKIYELINCLIYYDMMSISLEQANSNINSENNSQKLKMLLKFLNSNKSKFANIVPANFPSTKEELTENNKVFINQLTTFVESFIQKSRVNPLWDCSKLVNNSYNNKHNLYNRNNEIIRSESTIYTKSNTNSTTSFIPLNLKNHSFNLNELTASPQSVNICHIEFERHIQSSQKAINELFECNKYFDYLLSNDQTKFADKMNANISANIKNDS